ncbi:MAG: metallophosphoesterase [Armatimonadetes bacterium]|nr:metallophosphoesterase [Armatimonadota bacterium]
MTIFRPFVLAASLLVTAGCVPKESPQADVTTAATPPPVVKITVLEAVATPSGTFYTPPYLQLGENATDPATLAVVWHVSGTATIGDWRVETRSPAGVGAWKKQTAPVQTNPVNLSGVSAHTVYSAPLKMLSPGQPFDYRVIRGETPVFAARANRARPTPAQDFRMVIFGDCAEDTAWQKKVAYQTHQLKPDAVLITGDIVYPHGRASEYRANYFPVYQHPTPDPKRGAPLLASTLFIGASGNHDIAYANLNKYPDGLAYYYYWKQPVNGFGGGDKGEHPPITGNASALQKAAGSAYPTGANFSFDYGNAHFVVIDANYYMNWQSPALQSGLRKAITANPQAKWRFVVFHVPPFHSSLTHNNEQWMRRLSPIFEETGVDVVWSGHVHNYQRTFPLSFAPQQASGNVVGGDFSLDTTWDGKTVTKPNGVIYVVTGAGGAALYQMKSGFQTQDFTAKYLADTHSLTELSVSADALSVRQVDENGKQVDSWRVTK